METEEDATEIKTKPTLEHQGVEFLQQTGEFKITCQNGFTYHQYRKYKDVNIERLFFCIYKPVTVDSNVGALVSDYGWYILFGGVAVYLVIQHLSKRRGSQESSGPRDVPDPSTVVRRQEALDASRRRMQEELDAKAEQYKEKQKQQQSTEESSSTSVLKPKSGKKPLRSVGALVSDYGWYILFGGVAVYLVIQHLSKRRGSQESSGPRDVPDPSTVVRRQEALDASRRRMQEELDAKAEQYKEKQKQGLIPCLERVEELVHIDLVVEVPLVADEGKSRQRCTAAVNPDVLLQEHTQIYCD
ncbi:Selenoprotein S [Acipenser ruthenus]|uniref:Selenoprotein S n=1 Tax=Acipenser ruthenus TaxID=7906 RepID=A0A662YLX8_ACIRT|nr:Selenoprotein S [Acipenser ruthenus]